MLLECSDVSRIEDERLSVKIIVALDFNAFLVDIIGIEVSVFFLSALDDLLFLLIFSLFSDGELFDVLRR